MLKILNIFGTRPEAIKFVPVLRALEKAQGIVSAVCVSAQHREMLDQVLTIADIAPDYDLDLMRADQSLDQLTARLLTGIGKVLDEYRPDRVLVQGDTATAASGALAAYYRRIPVGHIEAGLRSYDIYNPWPEEVNRKIIGSIADLHFAPTPTAAAALRKEAVPADRIHVTGNTVIDALHWMKDHIRQRPALVSDLAPLERRFAGKRIIGVTTHRRENFSGGLANIAAAIREIAARGDVAIIFPVHPNPHVRAAIEPVLAGLPNVALIEPLDYPHFVHLLSMVSIMLTDSGGVQEEAPAFGKPVLIMRNTTERPEGVAAGTALLVGTDRARIVSEIFTLLDDEAAYSRMSRAHNPFGDGHAGTRIARILTDAHREDS